MTFGSFESIQPKSNLFHTSSEAVFNWVKKFQEEHSYFHIAIFHNYKKSCFLLCQLKKINLDLIAESGNLD